MYASSSPELASPSSESFMTESWDETAWEKERAGLTVLEGGGGGEGRKALVGTGLVRTVLPV